MRQQHRTALTSSRWAVILFITASLICHARASDNPERFYECQIEPRDGENFSFAQIQCWLPPANQHLNGILCVVLHPHGDAGVRFDNRQPWITLANRYNCALMSISFVERDRDINHWSQASKGTGRALLASIDKIAEESKTPALQKAKIIIAGICAAGEFAYEFSAFKTNRTQSFLTMGGSKEDTNVASQAATIPGLLIAAPDRGKEAINNMFSLFAEGRKHSAPWIFCAEPITNYDNGHCSKLTASFLETQLQHLCERTEQRIPSKTAGNLTVPLKEAGFPLKKYPNDISDVMAKILSVNLNCQFQDQIVQKEWLAQDQTPDPSGLSFVSIPLSKLGTATPQIVQMGTIPFESASTGYAATFKVSCEPGISAGEVEIIPDQRGLDCHVTHKKDSNWQVECKLDPKYLPCGSFNLEVPIRFIQNGKRISGGISCFLAGRVAGDISVSPIAINVGNVTVSNKDIRIHMKSISGSPIEVHGIQSSFPKWAKAEVVEEKGIAVEIQCKFSPPSDLSRDTFSGFFWIHAKSKYEQTIKLLFYGTITPK